MYQAFRPHLSDSQLAFRIGLARRRMHAYPLDRLDFILMDLERPELSSRHAHWCTGDLSGRTLEFLSVAEGVDGQHDPRLSDLFNRILRTRRPSGLFGRYATLPENKEPETDICTPIYRLFNGLIRYHEATGDSRALECAVDHGEWFLRNKDRWAKRFEGFDGGAIPQWITEPLARLYQLTGDLRFLEYVAFVTENIKTCQYMHAHGFLATMRGLQLAAIFTGDSSWNEKPEKYRRQIIDDHYQMPDGCISEMLPRGFRNEGCAIADWLMMNINAGIISGQDEPYHHAENILWNAVFFNQMITGGFGHRDLTPAGYAMGPVSEAWWCCTEHCGMAMAEFARSAVSLRGQTLWINQLVPGTFTLGAMQVRISTRYPAGGKTLIELDHVPQDIEVRIRVPACLAQVEVRQASDRSRIHIAGDIGHTLEMSPQGYLLKYGPLVLAPHVLYWGHEHKESHDNTIPDGYVPTKLPGSSVKLLVSPSPGSGFLKLNSSPLPAWSYFEMGPESPLCVAGASVHVPVELESGEKQTLWFAPLCHATSNQSFYDTPILFGIPID